MDMSDGPSLARDKEEPSQSAWPPDAPAAVRDMANLRVGLKRNDMGPQPLMEEHPRSAQKTNKKPDACII
eukprot:3641601-Rhodomonas_salina.1